MRRNCTKAAAMTACLLILGACNAPERGPFEGTWRMASYLKADTQVRYETDGYMMFGKEHWLHLMYFNRDERDLDFAEAHHGNYEVTGPDTFNMGIDMEMHMDPKSEYQETPVWYGPVVSLEGAKYSVDGNRVIMDLPSSAQLVLERVE
jgi:hypothetical protein